ncbi:hypothetical protein SAMN05421759_105110 [Roseivivax lentus]|uniref:Uncharacterized protein n=1 Tax=Roseivivax lentus TaxID=633194 RepID=A0A1N7MR66_9RHOB|nr:hypothetical protein [Roseivivax lentus]SIS88624.1 hypothetical protein SAMN05421759_105110 [Roseivivax lentus]
MAGRSDEAETAGQTDRGDGADAVVDLNQLFRRLAEQMACLEAQSQSAEACMAALLARAAGAEKAVAAPELQNLDRVTQTLGELHAFLRRAAEAAPPGIGLDLRSATEAVRLGALSEKLRGQTGRAAATKGSVELF